MTIFNGDFERNYVFNKIINEFKVGASMIFPIGGYKNLWEGVEGITILAKCLAEN